MDKSKSLGQVFTPQKIVEQILDEVGFTSETFTPGLRILEPSFGEGVFIKEIIRRIYAWGISQSLADSEIGTIVDGTVWGVEYDEELFAPSRSLLIAWARDEFNLTLALPNLHCADALDFEHYYTFDYVVGNPPYIRIHHMDSAMRDKVKTYAHSTGTTDLYIIFYELGLKWLNDNGVLGYIAPNSWLKNASQANFRQEIINAGVLKKIIDFGTADIFPGVGTYTCITILDKKAVHEDFTFSSRGAKQENHFDITLNLANLAARASAPLSFMSDRDYQFVEQQKTVASRTLGDAAAVQNGLATLSDKLYLFDAAKLAEWNIEPAATLPVVKASRYKGETVASRFLFPYAANAEGKLVGHSEEELKNKYPNAYAYFTSVKPQLEARSIDKGSSWFWYGRSQAVQATFQEKLVFAPIVGPEQETIKAYILPAGTLVYSGLFITVNSSGTSLKDVKKIIESPEFCKYIKIVGKDMSGGYKSMSSKMVKGFPIK